MARAGGDGQRLGINKQRGEHRVAGKGTAKRGGVGGKIRKSFGADKQLQKGRSLRVESGGSGLGGLKPYIRKD